MEEASTQPESSILDVNLNNVPDLEIASDGDEIHVTIMESKVIPIKSSDDPNAKQINVRMAPDAELMDDIYAYVQIPNSNDQERDKKKYIKACQRLRDFCLCFSIDFSTGVNLAGITGQDGYIIVGKEDNQSGDGQRNTVKKYIIPSA